MHYRYRYRCVSSIYSYHIAASSRFRKKKCIFWLCDNTQILEFTKGKKPHLILMCCRFFCSNCRFKRSFGEAHYRSSDMVYIQNIVCASFRISRASYCWCLPLVFFCCCLMFFFVNFVFVLSVVSSNVRVSIEQMYGFLTLLRMRIWMCVCECACVLSRRCCHRCCHCCCRLLKCKVQSTTYTHCS